MFDRAELCRKEYLELSFPLGPLLVEEKRNHIYRKGWEIETNITLHGVFGQLSLTGLYSIEHKLLLVAPIEMNQVGVDGW